MNEVYLIGKIITNIEYKFIVNSKTKKSIAMFEVKTLDKQNIKIKAYNELADVLYRKFNNKDNVFIYGRLNEDNVELKYIKTFD